MTKYPKELIEILPGLYFEVATGYPWSSRNGGIKGNPYGHPLIKLLSKEKAGYLKVKIEGRYVKWHRIVWEHFFGPIPRGLEIDHINNIRDDNRLENLQLLSHKENSRKQLKYSNNKTGFAGVSWCKRDKRFEASIRIDGKNKFLGYFLTPEEAYESYLKARIKAFGEESIKPLRG
jgi:hypothetical protein